MSFLLGDPPGVWALYRVLSFEGSNVKVAFDLTGYDERSLKLYVFCPTEVKVGCGGESIHLLYADDPCCRNGLEQGDTGKDVIILVLSLGLLNARDVGKVGFVA